MKVSVALCTWNGEKHLEQQLRSLLAQERPPDELVLRDDGSSDRTLEIARDLLSGAPFRVDARRNGTNLGSSANFEAALADCTGEVLFPCDQDDFWHPGKIDRVMQAFVESEAQVVFHDAQLVDVERRPLGRLWEGIGFGARAVGEFAAARSQFGLLVRRPHVTGCCMAVRREAFLPTRPFGRAWIHDEWMATSISARGGRLLPLPEALIDYRQHPVQQLGMNQTRRWRKLLNILEADAKWYLADASKMSELRDSIAKGPVDPSDLALVDERIRHDRSRALVGTTGRRDGFRLVWDEWRSGRYRRHSWWKAAALKDLARILASSSPSGSRSPK